MDNYQEFLASKERIVPATGFTAGPLNSYLYKFQQAIVRWAVKRGRAALFESPGLGKTIQMLEWCDQVVNKVSDFQETVLIIAPLSVAPQTVNEGKKFGYDVKICKRHEDLRPGINITNYEKLDNFDLSRINALCLDESSILKSGDGKYAKLLIEQSRHMPYKLACSATPAPNDYMEYGYHAEFLGICKATEMLAEFFEHDSGDTSKWELKGWARPKFAQWLAQWAIYIESPGDLGFQDEAEQFILPPLHQFEHSVESPASDGYLFAKEAKTLTERRQARRQSLSKRAALCADIVKEKGGQWLIWCNLVDEGTEIRQLIPNSVEIKGSTKEEDRERYLADFISGKVKVLISKPTIIGFGMNLQHCFQTAFVGLSDSWEQYYQALRRVYRFMQLQEVCCHVIISEAEGQVLKNIQRKEEQARLMASDLKKEMIGVTLENVIGATKQTNEYKRDVYTHPKFEIYLSDCVDLVSELPDNHIDLTITSLPFASLYCYSNSLRDMGNSHDDQEFSNHYRFLTKQQLRITKPGRIVAVHCMNLTTTKSNHGYIGMRDFRGDVIRLYQEAGFIFHSEVCIWKDPVTAMQRTKALGLLHKQLVKDSAMSRQGIPDYLVIFRKPGENEKPIAGQLEYYVGENSPIENSRKKRIEAREGFQNEISSLKKEIKDLERKFNALSDKDKVGLRGLSLEHAIAERMGWLTETKIDVINNENLIEKPELDVRRSIDIWQQYASPVWMDISQSKTLQIDSEREEEDSKHIAPLQLQVIERCLQLWSNPDDLIFDPFTGIGSTGHEAIRLGRRFIGSELKESYYRQAIKNLSNAVQLIAQPTLFDMIAGD